MDHPVDDIALWEDAKAVVQKLMRDYESDNTPAPSSHMEWLQREIVKVLHVKCQVQREREQSR